MSRKVWDGQNGFYRIIRGMERNVGEQPSGVIKKSVVKDWVKGMGGLGV